MDLVAFCIVLAAWVVLPLTLWLCRQYCLWHPTAKLAAKRGEYIHMDRRPGEKLSVYEKRLDAGWAELLDAGDAFIKAAYKEGWMTQENPRCTIWHLPPDHPVAIRYAKAKGLMH